MKKLALLVLGMALVSGSLLTAEEKADPLKDVVCVVSGKPINPEATAEYKHGKVYFCCPGCPGAFAKDTEKFAAKANHQLVQTKQYHQVKCPMSGKPGKDTVKVSVHGVDVTLCCQGCEKQAKTASEDKDNKDKVVELLFNDKAFEKGFEVVTK